MATKTITRKNLRYRLLGLLLLCGAGTLVFLPFKISLIPFLKPKLEAWKRLGISVEKIDITPYGQIHARGVILGTQTACRIRDLKLDVSLTLLIKKGRIVLQRVHANGVKLDWEKLDAFFADLQRQIPENYFREHLSSFQFNGFKMEITNLVPEKVLRLKRVKVGLKWRPALAADVDAKGVSLSGLPGFPSLPSLTFRFQGRPLDFRLEDLSTHLGPMGLQGWLARDARGNLQGLISFKQVDLRWLSKRRLSNGRILEGRFNGQADFRIKADKGYALQARGNAQGEKVRIGNFPFQRDPLVREYMPALRYTRFDTLRIAHWSLKDHQFDMDSISASGSPLSVQGGGRIEFDPDPSPSEGVEPKGKVFFNMTGHLTEHYFQNLGPLVQSGFYRDFQGRPTFRFRIRGDFEKQQIHVNKVKMSRVVKSLARGLKARLRSLVP